jgi:hypothetical protein
MEQGSSLSHTQVLATYPYPEPDQSSPCLHILKIHLNIIFQSTPGSSKWFVSFRSPHQNTVCTSPVSKSRHVSRFTQTLIFKNTNKAESAQNNVTFLYF